MQVTSDTPMRRVVGERLSVAVRYMFRAHRMLENYIDIGCPPYPRDNRGRYITKATDEYPSLLEHTRQMAVCACINIEASMLLLMGMPVLNTGIAADTAKSIKGLSARRKHIVSELLVVRKMLDDANNKILLTRDSEKRAKLRRVSRNVDKWMMSAVDVIEGISA